MKTFRSWLKEDGPTNGIGSGGGVRGLGNVTGDPGGDLTGYAAQNAAATPPAQSMVSQHMDMHGMGVSSLQAGMDADTKDNVLRSGKGKK